MHFLFMCLLLLEFGGWTEVLIVEGDSSIHKATHLDTSLFLEHLRFFNILN